MASCWTGGTGGLWVSGAGSRRGEGRVLGVPGRKGSLSWRRPAGPAEVHGDRAQGGVGVTRGVIAWGRCDGSRHPETVASRWATKERLVLGWNQSWPRGHPSRGEACDPMRLAPGGTAAPPGGGCVGQARSSGQGRSCLQALPLFYKPSDPGEPLSLDFNADDADANTNPASALPGQLPSRSRLQRAWMSAKALR